MTTDSQIQLFLWKNWTLHNRQKIRLFVEIMWPAVLCLGLVWLRKAIPLYQHHQCHFPNKAMPSAGIFPWIQGIFCNINNPCFWYPTPGESPGLYSNNQNSILAHFYGDVQELLLSDPNFQQMGRLWNELTIMSTFMHTLRNNPTQISGCGLKIKDVLKDNETLSSFMLWEVFLPDFVIHQLVNAQVRLKQFASGVPDLRLKDLACCQVLLERYIPSPSLCGVCEAVCTLSQQKLHAIEDSMYDNIDFFKLFHLLPRVLDRHTAGPDLRLWGKVLLGTSKKLHQCLDLNKFVGLSVEGQMTVKTLDLQGENKLWAGLVFLDMTPWTSELPAHIKFKIHMDIDSVERTNEINNREFNPLVTYCLISQAKIFQIT
ncbi:retinal-specific phospholipid-transporting ATPase ABCA4-like [Brienomyrus brachyistius]|uniref:retinal-specific phospholipid-transporting ATPase ABCA4-like n=1 Tax=Brienomyrus brachyistius TaxID=42636 RepID=UPI0020B186AD|nr:retinal-specific phospholipid-transporting ATPase ABCA4-like [Brienomyrus brachyistius]